MFTHDDNERLTRVGPGTPGGELFRRYWQPALLSTEVSETDGAPIRVRLLGEDLIAFRSTDGRIGLVDAYCPHRRAPMFYGRNEECGLRCVYHGWKFDVNGQCVDLPTEPSSSKMKDHIKIKSYPTVERGGLVWTYMGPADQQPDVPDFEWFRAPETHRAVSKNYQANNYLQGLEGGLDTAHTTYLHNNKIGDKSSFFVRDGAPRIEVHDTDYGYHYVAKRKIGEDRDFVRVYQYIMPAQQIRPNVTPTRGDLKAWVPRVDGHIWVPIDDEQTFVYNWVCGIDQDARIDPHYAEGLEAGYGRGQNDFIPGTFRLKANGSNDYFIDRDIQKTTTFTGIKGINTQDVALQEGMGVITDRARHNLGSSDKAIIAMRNLLLAATQVVERGERPRGIDPSTYRSARPHDGVIALDSDWQDQFKDKLAAVW